MRPAVLFDLGNTLARYYRTDQFRPILETAVADVLRELDSLGLGRVTFDAALSAAISENEEAPDHRFRPMAERFERIFDISLADDPALAGRLCAIFLRPIFDIGRLYEDALPVLDLLRRGGHPTAIVSNAPWGSPPGLWRDELGRLGLAASVDCVVFCGDVGWRKPAPAIFELAARGVDREPEQCVFVGDDPCWDVSGSRAAGMRPILIDRDRGHSDHGGCRIEELFGLLEIVAAGG